MTNLNYKNLFILLACISILSFFIGAYCGAIRERSQIEKRYIEVQQTISNNFERDLNFMYKDYIINGL